MSQPCDGRADRRLVADVALELPQMGMVLDRGQGLLAIDIEVQDVDAIAEFQQPGHQHGPDVSCPAGDEDPATF